MIKLDEELLALQSEIEVTVKDAIMEFESFHNVILRYTEFQIYDCRSAGCGKRLWSYEDKLKEKKIQL